MKVRFEPIGEEIDCAPEETVLDAAFRQGYNLAYGCREGQCSACKCFLIEGDVALKPYSNFALSDSEQSSGYSLMCRAMPEQDLVVELLHYDPDNYRLENPIRDGVATRRSDRAADARHHAPGAGAPSFEFTAGPVRRPLGSGNRRRGTALVLDRQPAGRGPDRVDDQALSGRAAVGNARRGDHRRLEIRFTGPYGAFHLRALREPADPDDRRRLGDGADPGAAAPARRRRVRAARAVLLRRAHRGRPVPPGRDRRSGRAAGGFRVHSGRGRLRARGGRRLASSATTTTSICAARRRCSRPPSRC